MSEKYRNQSSPWGFFPISLVELKTGVSLKRYVFQAAGVLICKAHYSNKTLKQSSISQCSQPVSTPAPVSLTIGFLSSFRAQSQDLSIDILSLTFTLSIMSLICELGHSSLAFCRLLFSVLEAKVEEGGVLKHLPKSSVQKLLCSWYIINL